MSRVQNSGLKFAYFLLGVTAPIAGYLLWIKTDGFRCFSKKAHADKMHDITVEESFPASDPPSAW